MREREKERERKRERERERERERDTCSGEKEGKRRESGRETTTTLDNDREYASTALTRIFVPDE